MMIGMIEANRWRTLSVLVRILTCETACRDVQWWKRGRGGSVRSSTVQIWIRGTVIHSAILFPQFILTSSNEALGLAYLLRLRERSGKGPVAIDKRVVKTMLTQARRYFIHVSHISSWSSLIVKNLKDRPMIDDQSNAKVNYAVAITFIEGLRNCRCTFPSDCSDLFSVSANLRSFPCLSITQRRWTTGVSILMDLEYKVATESSQQSIAGGRYKTVGRYIHFRKMV